MVIKRTVLELIDVGAGLFEGGTLRGWIGLYRKTEHGRLYMSVCRNLKTNGDGQFGGSQESNR